MIPQTAKKEKENDLNIITLLQASRVFIKINTVFFSQSNKEVTKVRM